MKIKDIMLKELMILPLESGSKAETINEMTARLYEQGIIDDLELFREGILNRESQASTGIGEGIAMPHAKNTAVKRPAVVFAKSETGVDYDSLDGQPAYLFFMIAAPDNANDVHLQVLASLSRLLLNPDLIAALKQATTAEEVEALFEAAERAKDAEESADTVEVVANSERPFVVAVTACPTGIAHTYMAEDALKKKAAEMGVDIKVETNGSDGTKNRLTAADIERASAVIAAVGKKVEMNRFKGKRVLERPVADGINKAEELITKAVNQEAPIFHGDSNDTAVEEEYEKTSEFSSLYKDLMNGISHMLPFVVGGGILLAISFLFENWFGNESALFLSFNQTGAAAFQFLIPILAGYIAYSIADRPGLLPGMAGGFMAVQSNAGFLGGLIAGFLAGYVMNWVKRSFSTLPKALAGLKTILLFPVFGLLVTGLVMYYFVGPVFATINNAMLDFLAGLGTGNAVLLGAVLGGMMAIDMGGPFNKAAYAFSIGIFTDTGDGRWMAAVMAGGMIPPIAIALATFLFQNKFNEVERQSGLSNLIMGLSFITEGAIPFAAADPLRVIGSSIVGSAIAGGLTQYWNTSIPAPHGGIFVIGLADNALLFLVALAIGAAVSAVLLGILRKPVAEEDASLKV
ncbi:PTS fructose transporter subunit IIABC [Jeotgalibaca sp. A127]|uniref:PTS fructose transporter subunit IIABC n=1 Tax=Jeotgalibaca sp. A127 TaxID=3457324 RepID=UPI003FCF3D93